VELVYAECSTAAKSAKKSTKSNRGNDTSSFEQEGEVECDEDEYTKQTRFHNQSKFVIRFVSQQHTFSFWISEYYSNQIITSTNIKPLTFRVQQSKFATTDIKKVVLSMELFDFLHDTARDTPDEVIKSPSKRSSPAIKVQTNISEGRTPEEGDSKTRFSSPLRVHSPLTVGRPTMSPIIVPSQSGSALSTATARDPENVKLENKVRYSPGMKRNEWSGSVVLPSDPPSGHLPSFGNQTSENIAADKEQLSPIQFVRVRAEDSPIEAPLPKKKAKLDDN
jgi:hypothetical protein